nr:GntR family transcriptional regulator [Demetria terragena]
MSAMQVPIVIDRSSPVPLYHQLAQQFQQAVTDGRLQPGDPFENEVAIAQRLRLSRPTVRRAIQELVDQGLVIRRRGLGTTVSNRKVHRKVGLTSLYDDLQGAGQTPRTELLELELVENEPAAVGLDLPPDTPLLYVKRLRFAGDSPLALLQNWLPPAYHDLSEDELRTGGMYQALHNRGVRPVVARQSIGARMPTAPERRHLQLRGTQPLLTMTRLAFDSAGQAVEYGDHCYRAADYTIDLMLDER